MPALKLKYLYYKNKILFKRYNKVPLLHMSALVIIRNFQFSFSSHIHSTWSDLLAEWVCVSFPSSPTFLLSALPLQIFPMSSLPKQKYSTFCYIINSSFITREDNYVLFKLPFIIYVLTSSKSSKKLIQRYMGSPIVTIKMFVVQVMKIISTSRPL